MRNSRSGRLRNRFSRPCIVCGSIFALLSLTAASLYVLNSRQHGKFAAVTGWPALGALWGAAVLTDSSTNQPLKTPTPSMNVKEVARALDPELMAHVPNEYLPEFANPCWRVGPGGGAAGEQAGDLRCLPGVYVTGSFQAGAATLYHKLSEHPDILTNDAARWQFWAEDTKRMAEYVEKNSRSAKQIVKAPHKLIMDGSASTFAFYWSAALRTHRSFQSVLMPCWHNCSETSRGKVEARSKCMDSICHPKAMASELALASKLKISHDDMHVPLLMSAAYSNKAPKLIVLLRDPIARLHCAYWQYPHYYNKYGKTAEGFLAYVKQQVGELRACAARGPGYNERHCALYLEALGAREEQLYFHADQIIRGMYSIFVEVWLRHFKLGRDVLIIKSEDYFAQPDETVQRTVEFLGLKMPTDDKVLKTMYSAGKPSTYTTGKPAMLPEARQLLQEFYKPYNEQLAKLLNDPRYLEWNK